MATKEPEEETLSESYISVGLGLLVVVVVGILLYNYFTQRRTQPEVPDTADQEQAAREATQAARPGSTYIVTEGDTLWSIAEKAYKSGYNWKDIMEANTLTAPDAIEPGQELIIPDATPLLPTTAEAMVADEAITPSPAVAEQKVIPTPMATPAPSPVAEQPTTAEAISEIGVTTSEPAITGSSYTVVSGDTLWNIACRAYGDCFAWTRVAQANNLDNPDLIHPGNVFTLPR